MSRLFWGIGVAQLAVSKHWLEYQTSPKEMDCEDLQYHRCVLGLNIIIKCSLPANPALWSWHWAHVFCMPSSDRCCCNLQEKSRWPWVTHRISEKHSLGKFFFFFKYPNKTSWKWNSASESRGITQSPSCNALGGDTCEGVWPNAHDIGHCAVRASHSSAV